MKLETAWPSRHKEHTWRFGWHGAGMRRRTLVSLGVGVLDVGRELGEDVQTCSVGLRVPSSQTGVSDGETGQINDTDFTADECHTHNAMQCFKKKLQKKTKIQRGTSKVAHLNKIFYSNASE